MDPRVTIGLPTYNSERFLPKLLKAILGQTYKNFILVINDDGSTDRTDEICRAQAAIDQRIRYTRHAKNLGGAINYQRVFNLAKTEYFRWAAHDDLIAPELLERCIEVLDNQPDVVLCYPRAYNIDINDKIIGECNDRFHFVSPSPSNRFHGVLSRMYGHSGNPLFGVVRRDIMAHTVLIAPFPSSDMTFLAELSLYGKFHEIQDRLFYHRFHSGMSNQLRFTASQYTAWHDRSKVGKISFPKLLRLQALINAVQKAPLGSFERVKCHLYVLLYYTSPLNLVKLLRQVVAYWVNRFWWIRLRTQEWKNKKKNKWSIHV
jgi:glycosyltransferase involved in cell wall biosynthesis